MKKKDRKATSPEVSMGPDHPRWETPIRRGETYCSPFCGGGCTHASYVRAHNMAKALAKRLGPGWQAHVWENLGWHWSAISPCGQIKVHPHNGQGLRVTGYCAFFGRVGSPGGEWTADGRTPGRAVNEVIAEVTRRRNQIARQLNVARRSGSGPL